MLTHGSLFSGIGGFDLGFERAGIKTIWQVEVDEYATKILEKNFPAAQRFSDVLTVGAHCLQAVDIVSGGFPCQDISEAGKRRGIHKGARSGLWKAYLRVVRELQPRYVVVENVAALTHRGLGTVLGDLHEAGYDAEWTCLQALDFGLPHKRERVFIVAYADSLRREPGNSRPRILSPAPPPVERDEAWGLLRDYDGRSGRVWQAPELVFEPVAHGIPEELARLRACGNAVVPRIAEYIGKGIVRFESQRRQVVTVGRKLAIQNGGGELHDSAQIAPRKIRAVSIMSMKSRCAGADVSSLGGVGHPAQPRRDPADNHDNLGWRGRRKHVRSMGRAPQR